MPENEKITTQEDTKESSEDTTQQTKNQEDQHTDEESYSPDYVRSLEQRIAEQQIANRRMEILIDRVKEPKNEEAPTPKPRNVEEERNRFYTDPVGELESRDRRLLSEMQKMLTPLTEVASTFRATSEYDRIKASLKVDPMFGNALKDSEIESTVDAIMRSGVEITEDNVKSAITQAYGLKAMGGFGTRKTNNNNDRERIDPPNIPPTRNRVQQPNEATRKELTEDDRLAMRIAGLTPGNAEHEKEYWSLIADETMVLSVHNKKKDEGK